MTVFFNSIVGFLLFLNGLNNRLQFQFSFQYNEQYLVQLVLYSNIKQFENGLSALEFCGLFQIVKLVLG